MKKIAILALSAFMMTSVAAFGADMTKEQKDQCLLAAKDCKGEVDSIQKKMKKLDAEIKKGKKVYSVEELKKLQQKLDEADKMLDTLTAP
jgi:type II secretory pathway predicted ATPase ExeA